MCCHTGSLPAAWSAFDQLVYLNVSNNKLQGQVPLQWVELNISTMDLSANPQ